MIVVRNFAILIATIAGAAGLGSVTAKLIANVSANPLQQQSGGGGQPAILACTNCGGDGSGGWNTSPIPPNGCPLINSCFQNFSAGTGLIASQPPPPNPGQCFYNQVDQAINGYRASIGLNQIVYPQPGFGFFMQSQLQQNLDKIADQRISDMLLNNVIGTVDTHGDDIVSQLAANQIFVQNAALLEYMGCMGNPPDFRAVMDAWLSNADAVAVLNNPNWTVLSYRFAIGPPFNNPPASSPTGKYFVFTLILAQ